MIDWSIDDVPLNASRQHDIAAEDVRAVVLQGEVIAEYADDTPFASRLMLGWVKDRPLHVVAADDDEAGVTIIVTAYVPDPDLWSDDYRSRRQ